ncbi:carbohydrate-binding protein, partial [bacterium]|nr:carbohydrate-binding protein [bacterium]
SESVDIEPIAGGGYNIGWINANEWLSYTVDVKAVGTFTAKIHYAANGGGNEAVLNVDGVDKSGVLTFPTSVGAWASQSVDIQLAPGKHVIKLFIKTASTDFKLDKIEFTEKNVVYPNNGTGLNASIWAATLGGRTWFKDSICSQIQPVVSQSWGDVSPGCGVNKDFWNIRWQGEIQALYTEIHTFYLTVNDMGRVWINNELIIDGWNSASTGITLTGTIALTAGQKVPIKVEFAEKTGDASINFEWSSPSMFRWSIPQSQLFPLVNPNGLNEVRTANFSVFPNPATNKLNLNSGLNNVESIQIVDLQGRVVYTNTEQFSGQKSFGIKLEKGIYFIKLTGKVPYANQKLIIK